MGTDFGVKSKSKKVWIIAVVIILIFGLGAITYSKNLIKLPEGNTSNPPSSNKVDEKVNNNWSNFSKTDIPYSFQYPKELKLLEEDRFVLFLKGKTQKPDTEFYDGISLGFSAPEQFSGGSLEDFVKNKMEKIKQEGLLTISKPQEEIIVNGIKGYTFTVEGLGTVKYIFLLSPDSKWLIEISNATVDPTNQGYSETVEQILSTFKFN